MLYLDLSFIHFLPIFSRLKTEYCKLYINVYYLYLLTNCLYKQNIEVGYNNIHINYIASE